MVWNDVMQLLLVIDGTVGLYIQNLMGNLSGDP